jgi:hypothetical protein
VATVKKTITLEHLLDFCEKTGIASIEELRTRAANSELLPARAHFRHDQADLYLRPDAELTAPMVEKFRHLADVFGGVLPANWLDAPPAEQDSCCTIPGRIIARKLDPSADKDVQAAREISGVYALHRVKRVNLSPHDPKYTEKLSRSVVLREFLVFAGPHSNSKQAVVFLVTKMGRIYRGFAHKRSRLIDVPLFRPQLERKYTSRYLVLNGTLNGAITAMQGVLIRITTEHELPSTSDVLVVRTQQPEDLGALTTSLRRRFLDPKAKPPALTEEEWAATGLPPYGELKVKDKASALLRNHLHAALAPRETANLLPAEIMNLYPHDLRR